jgi:hypothetical protein
MVEFDSSYIALKIAMLVSLEAVLAQVVFGQKSSAEQLAECNCSICTAPVDTQIFFVNWSKAPVSGSRMSCSSSAYTHRYTAGSRIPEGLPD